MSSSLGGIVTIYRRFLFSLWWGDSLYRLGLLHLLVDRNGCLRVTSVASRLQGLTEAVADKKTGLLFEPGNAQMLADYIELLLDKRELAAEYGRQGRLRCENELSYEHQEKAFLGLVKKRIGLSPDN